MKAVILAAGQGMRMRPLTLNTPKPLLRVNGKPIIDYILESFPTEINEVIISVKYLAGQIKKHVNKKSGFKVRYVVGSDKGSAYSFIAARKHLNDERFLVVQGDDIPHPDDIANCLKKDLSYLTFESHNPQAHGIGYLRKDGSIKKIIEKPKKTTSTLGVNGVMVLNTNIFNYSPTLIRGEYYFSTMIGAFVRDHKVFPVANMGLIGDITTPKDLIRAGKILNAREK